MDDIGIAVVGAGYWGPNLIRNIQASPATSLRWVIDFDEQRAASLAGGQGGASVSASLDDALDDPTVTAVAVATPPASHVDLTMRALAAGRHVLVEKPLATTVSEGRKMVAEARRRDLVLMCDHTFCYTPVVAYIRSLIRSGDLGDIHYVDSVRANLGLVQSDVDVFWDLAPHDLSILDFVLPDSTRPLQVAAHGADPIGAGQCCVGYLTMPLANGAIGHVSVNWLSPTKIRQTVIAGSKKMVVWNDMTPYQRLAVVDKGIELLPAVGDDKRRLLVDYRLGDMVIPHISETTEALRLVVEEFAGAISEHRAPLTGGESGVRVLEVLEAASASLEQGGRMIQVEAP